MPLNRIQDYHKTLPIIELYPCIQGEGARTGTPTIAVRTTGCTHRCYFGETGGWCDTWYSSIHPERGRYCFEDIINLYAQYPDIKELMLTGGAPSMHSALINELSVFAHENDILITMETEGSHYIETAYPIGLLSISPKLSNSVPEHGMITPRGKIVDQKFIDQHNKYRCRIETIQALIAFHQDYQLKFVWDGAEQTSDEIEAVRRKLDVAKSKTYIMPAGQTRAAMIAMYPKTLDFCLENGYCFTGRTHIIAYDDQRGV